MSMTDIFNTDAFSVVSMTEAINKLPFKPSRLGEMGLFEEQGITTTTAIIEEKEGVLSLIPSTVRGGPPAQNRPEKRKVYSIPVPHIPLEDSVLAVDVQDKRAFGSEDAEEALNTVVNNKLESMKRSQEATLEWLRMGALKGTVLDGDGSTELADLWTLFSITESETDFVLGTDTTDVGAKILTVVDVIEDALGASQYDHIHCLCGSDFWAALTGHPEVKYAFQYYQESRMLREDPRSGFEYKGVIFEKYRATIDSQAFIAVKDARFFPVGVPGLFKTVYAPGNFTDAANTIGLPLYARQETQKYDRGIDILVESNPLPFCTRPRVLCRGYYT